MKALRISIALLFGFCSLNSLAQAPPGTPPFGTFSGGPVDTVNVSDLNIHFSIPIFFKSGRGVSLAYALQYDSSFWSPNVPNFVNTWAPITNNFGWQRLTEVLAGYVTYTVQSYPGCNIYSNWQYYDSSGTLHPLFALSNGNPISIAQPGCGGQTSQQGTATDGSGFQLKASVSGSVVSAIVYPPGGGSIVPPQQNPNGNATITDANGNVLSVNVSGSTTTVTDTQGTAALTINGNPPSSYSYTAPNGGTSTVTLTYTTMTVQTNFNCYNISEYGAHSASLLTKITLPDQTTYQFTYESTPGLTGKTTGRIASITLPTGGAVSFAYTGQCQSGGVASGIFRDGSAAGLTRTLTPGGNQVAGTWTYTRNMPQIQTTVTDPTPQANQTVYTFSGIYQTQKQIYSGSSSGGTLLQTDLTCYNNNSTNCATATVTAPITRQTVLQTLQHGREAEYDSQFNNGLLTEMDTYDYGVSALGPILSKKVITYNTSLGNNITNRPASISVLDGSNNTLAQTTFAYDESAYPLVSTANYSPPVPQHVAISGSRGNLTSANSWVGGSTYLSKHFTYYDTGTPSTVIDVNGSTAATYAYSSGGSCGYSFVTGITYAIAGLGTQTSWNCADGVAASQTGLNGEVTSFSYDSSSDHYIWRLKQVTDPLGNITNISYSPNAVESQMIFNTTSIMDSNQVADGLGRLFISQRRQGATGASYNALDSVETDRDVAGNPYRSTMPYVAGVAQTDPDSSPIYASTTTYDAIHRPVQVTDGGGGTATYDYYDNDVLITGGPGTGSAPATARQLEYDAAGRLKSVCEITAGNPGAGWPAADCGQSRSETGYLTKYTYDAAGRLLSASQDSQTGSGYVQTRTLTYDGLGRMLSEVNPEAGTTTYTYDTASTGSCILTNLGDLIFKHDAAGNTICYAHDVMHRVTSIGYYDGPYQNTTPAKFFVYDAASYYSTPMANAKGRLARAYTAFRPYTSVNTDLFLNYSARGETLDTYEATLNSGGYFHLTASYWPHGMLQTLSGLSGLPATTYGGSIGGVSGLDGEGRYVAVTAATLPNPVTSVTYNNTNPAQTVAPVGALLALTLGSNGVTSSDSYSWDKTTGRMTNYTFLAANYLDAGNLVWNSNGSLSSLAISDQFNAQDSQTCNYTHDEFARVASANCGTTWSQTFTYDPFGNINKSGNVSFGGFGFYDPSHNQVYQNPLTMFGYDANGNILSAGGVHNYTWDADGKMVSADTVSLIAYDALGRMVEQTSGSAHTQIVYSPTGDKLALMNGTTNLVKAYVPLPGGGRAVYAPSGLAYYQHADWLGSLRLATSRGGSSVWDGAYAPFGESYSESPANYAYHSFTGQNEDTVQGLDDFMFREYSVAQQGRWISPDPAGLAAINPNDPQSWNRYAYVANRPLNSVDPFGLCGFDDVVDASKGSVDLSPGALQDCNDRDTFKGDYFDLPGHEDIIGQALGRYQAQVDQGFSNLLNQEYGCPVGADCKADVTIDVPCSGDVAAGDYECQFPESPFTYGGTFYAGWYASAATLRLTGQLGGFVTTPQFVAVFYAVPALGAAAGDIGLVEEGNLFGTRFAGNMPLLNSSNVLRVGWSYVGNGQYVFRIGGSLLGTFLQNPHINLWPPSWWLGPPVP